MSEVIEMTDLAADAEGRELRIGDRVRLVMNDAALPGTISAITKAEGDIVTPEGVDVTVEVPPVITVVLDDGRIANYGTQYLRLNVWRWTASDLKREPSSAFSTRPSAQGAD